MKMLILRNGRPTDSGAKTLVPIVRTKNRKYGRALAEHWLSVKRDVMIVGAAAAGKTRWLTRLHAGADAIWHRQPAILLRAVNPIGAWTCDPRIADHMEKTVDASWSRLRCWERGEWLIAWVKATRAVVLLDDAHLLAGRKLDLAQRLVAVAGRVVTGASAESRIPINLRMTLLARDPYIESLRTEAAYDMTNLFMWLVILCCLSAGAWQLAAVLGGMKMLGRGSRAARQS